MRIPLLYFPITALLGGICCVKLTKAEWWDKYKVLEQVNGTWKKLIDGIKYCPNNEQYTRVPDPTSCSVFIACDWSKINTTNSIFVSKIKCFACPNSKNKAKDCPGGYKIASSDLGCVHPNRLTSIEHRCGTKAQSSNCSGPIDTQDIHRLGKSGYYVFQNANRTNLVNWKEAKEMCEKAGLKLAKIDNLQTEVLVGRELEKFIRPLGWINNWYWLNAKFDRKLKTYVWQDTMQPLNFSNFFYRAPRPKGYGDFFDIKGNYVNKPTVEHCLAQSMPLNFPRSTFPIRENVPFGFHTAWWERPCHEKQKGNVLCESTQSECHDDRERSVFTESNGHYYEGFWPISNRRFVVMWTAKSLKDAKQLCEDHNMQLYSPDKDDTCLPPILKIWMSKVTSFSFWTDVKYKVRDRKFVYPNGMEVPLNIRNVSLRIQKRNAETAIEETCVSLTWNFEEFPKNPNFCNCSFNSVILSPENCKNKIGVICQHLDKEKRHCTTEFYEKGVLRDTGVLITKEEKHPKIMEFYPFDSNGSWPEGVMRSAFKQQGDSGQCLDGYTRVTENDTYWGTVVDYQKSSHKYDFLASYWMRPDATNGRCSLSTVTYDAKLKKLTQSLSNEMCSKYLGFILCRKISKKDVIEAQDGRGVSRLGSLPPVKQVDPRYFSEPD